MRELIVGFEMLQYGSVMAWGRRIPSAEAAALPQGESDPPLLYWLDKLARSETLEDFAATARQMRDELDAWRRRPDPPPAGETLDELKQRVLSEGKGWTPHEVALAMRVTPTFVRNVRAEAERDPQTGRPDDRLAKGLKLLADGYSLRQVESITGVPKSTLHDAAKAAA
jgi:anaerobic selenocysteine-containing dehydrogenase